MPGSVDGVQASTEGTGLRRLLQRLKQVMQAPGTSDQRLDRLVRLVAEHFQAEVCSVYILKAEGILELFATRGLRAEAVHRTRLRLGEGLVGDIAEAARPLAFLDAQAHPKFAYRPETGEEIYQSFLGVPILRADQVLGTVAVQNVRRRSYSPEEIEALEIVAIVLGESLASGELRAATAEDMRRPMRFAATPLNAGLAIGTAVLHGHDIVISRVVSDDPAGERARLEAALEEMRGVLDRRLATPTLPLAGEQRDVLETFQLFANDRGWIARIREAIDRGLTAEAAVDKVLSESKAHMSRIPHPYLRERLADVNDLGTRLLRHLLGTWDSDRMAALPADAIIVAGHLGPAEFLDYDTTRLRALVLAEASQTAHVAILARSLGLPVLGDCRTAVTAIRSGDRLIVDADNGQLLIRPARDVVRAFEASLGERARQRQALEGLRNLPAVTRDGLRIELLANAGLLADLPLVEESGAEGIGLYRTEVPFMVRDSLPDVATQSALYQRVLEQLGDRPVAFRTLDIGGDKVPGFLDAEREENPALGWRGIRIGLDRPQLLREQMRALIRACAGRPLRLLFPMVSRLSEFDAARALLEAELERAGDEAWALPSALEVGVMLEVPALLWQLDRLLERVDFISVGSNDLVQFLFAADRGSARLADRFDALSPEVLRIFRALTGKARRAAKAISLCGEAAGGTLEAMAFIGCGFRQLSMNPARIGPVKDMVRKIEVGALEEVLEELLQDDGSDIREGLRRFALDRGVSL